MTLSSKTTRAPSYACSMQKGTLKFLLNASGLTEPGEQTESKSKVTELVATRTQVSRFLGLSELQKKVYNIGFKIVLCILSYFPVKVY